MISRDTARFTIVGAYSGKVFARRVDLASALTYAAPYAGLPARVRELGAGESAQSHGYAAGIVVHRTV